MHRVRFPRRAVLALAVLVLAMLAATLASAHAAAARGQAAGRQAATAVTVADRSQSGQGGICSVPGIGDIGGLLGLCSLGHSGLTGDINNICQPSLPNPEPADAGINTMIEPPAPQGKQPRTLYGSYGMAGQYWAATNLQCSDMTSLIGNNVATMVFDIAKSIDRVTITVYQSAAGQGVLGWLTSVVDKLVSSIGNAIYFPYLAVAVLIAAIWLAWQGLIRKRGTRTIEGTVWMVVACAAAIWLIGRPADFTGAGKSVSDGIGQALNAAFAKLPSPGQSTCLPVTGKDPQARPASYGYAQGNGVITQNADELWTVLVCKPWLDGEFGTTNFATSRHGTKTPVNAYGRQLLWAQAIAVNEHATPALIKAKQSTYSGIATSMQQRYPETYPLFQGKQWTTRLEIAFAALFAALIAGVLVLLIAVTLILLKLGFLLLLVVGPLFLLIGIHPGFGRVVALRWFEMLVGVLLKQGAVALALSVLLYSYTLIMGTSDAVLPWALKVLMIALVSIAVFIYRRPFQHLFSAVGYGVLGSTERAEQDMARARATMRESTLGTAAAAASGLAAYRAARWARRGTAQTAALAHSGSAAAVGGVGAADPGADGAPVTVPADSAGTDPALAGGAAADGGQADGGRPGGRARAALRGRGWAAASAGDGSGRAAPPLNLPSRDGPRAGAHPGANGGTTRPGAGQPRSAAASARSASAAPARVPQAPAAPAPVAPAPAAPAAPTSTAAAGGPPERPVAPARSSGTGWPWRPGMTTRQSSPASPTGGDRHRSGPWVGTGTGRQAPAASRPPASAPPASAPPASAPPASAPPASAPPAAAPARRSSAGSGASGRRPASAPQAPARGPASGPQAPARRPEPAPQAPPRRPAPAPQAPPRRPAPTRRGASAAHDAATPRDPADAPAPRGPARGGAGAVAPGPFAARNREDPPEPPMPFWLRPIRRRK